MASAFVMYGGAVEVLETCIVFSFLCHAVLGYKTGLFPDFAFVRLAARYVQFAFAVRKGC